MSMFSVKKGRLQGRKPIFSIPQKIGEFSKRVGYLAVFLVLISGCQIGLLPRNPSRRMPADVYYDKVYGAWKAIMVANHTGLQYEGLFLDEPSPDNTIQLALLEQWPTDDDTAVEWVDLHILETYGIEPTYAQIAAEWVDHLNHDIWVSTRRARDLMDKQVLPPQTGSAALNPEGVWSIDAQLETELFGLIAPGMPEQASRRARFFARITNSGLAVEASAFYATLYALAFFEDDIPLLLERAQAHFSPDAEVNVIVDQVRSWYRSHPGDWRATRALIREVYDTDPQWWASRVNFASSIMALLYGQGDMLQTMTIAALAGWDADNNVTTCAGLLGVIAGHANLPLSLREASDVYFNEDVTGDMPRFQSLREIAARTQSIAEEVILASGGRVAEGEYIVPVGR